MRKYRGIDRLAELGVGLLVVGVPFALGGAHRPTMIAAALLASLTLLCVWLHRRERQHRLRLSLLGMVLLAATAWTALQLVPLPLSLLRLIAPGSAHILEVSLADMGGAPSMHPISLDPAGTLEALLVTATAVFLFIAAHNLYHDRRRRGRLLIALLAAGTVQVVIALLGAVVAPHRPLLLHTPAPGGRGTLIVTSFINANHGAAFLALCTVAGIGIALHTRDLQRKVMVVFLCMLTGVGVFLTLSRGGILNLATGVVSLALLLLLLPDARRHRGGRRVAVAVLGVGGVAAAVAALIGFDDIVRPFAAMMPEDGLDLGKISLWGPGLDMVKSNALVGVGRGAFRTTFPFYQYGDLPRVTFSHLENQYLHLPAEWGVPMAAMVIGGSALALIRWVWSSAHSTATLATAAALVGLGVHNLVDFNLELLGLALPAAALAGLLSASASTIQISRDSVVLRRLLRHPRVPNVMPPMLSGMLGCFALWMAVAAPPTAEEDARHLATLFKTGVRGEMYVAAADAAVRRHPADYMPHLAMARAAQASGSPLAFRALNRATRLFPRSPQAHLMTAELLRSAGAPRQALLEYRLAMAYGDRRPELLRRALELVIDQDDLQTLLRDDPRVHEKAARMLLAAGRGDLAVGAAQSARRRWPDEHRLALIEARALSGQGKHQDAVARAREVCSTHPSAEAYAVWAEAARAAGTDADAVPVLRRAVEVFPHQADVALALAGALLRAGDAGGSRRVAERVLAQHSDRRVKARAHRMLFLANRAAGRTNSAEFHRERHQRLTGQP